MELAALTETGLVLGAVVQALGLCEEPGRPLLQTLIDALQDRRLLLVLDNCKHPIAAYAALASPLPRVPRGAGSGLQPRGAGGRGGSGDGACPR